jgi:hypothetical protein
MARTASTEDYVRRVDDALRLPFSDIEQSDMDGRSGPGYHRITLHRRHDFWADADLGLPPAEVELGAELEAVAGALTTRWGQPEIVSLTSRTPPAPPSIAHFFFASWMRIWRPPATPRFVALVLEEGDEDLPYELIVAVGETGPLDDYLANGDVRP